MTRNESKMLKGLAGGLIGYVTGVCSVPFYMAADVIAPVTYPAVGALLGAGVGFNANHPVIGCAVGMAAGAASVPAAPISFLNRWWVMPFYFAGAGAGIAISL